jgi:hypothetical protein
MTTQSVPRRHHTVPKFLLRRFAADDQVQLVWRDDLSRSFPTNVDNALVETDFYNIETDAGASTEVEELLGTHIEGPAARALRRVVDESRFPPMPGLRETLSQFFSFQFVRGPAMRHMLVNQFKATAVKIASLVTPEMARKHLRETDGREPTDDEVTEFAAFAHQTDEDRVQVDKEANLHLGMALGVVYELLPYFARRRWQLLHFNDPLLITGDEPVGLIGASTRAGDRSLGLGMAPELVIPTDPTHALVLVRPDRTTQESILQGTPEMARIINLNLAYGCHRFLVHRPGATPLRGLSLPNRGPSVRVKGDYIVTHARPARASVARKAGIGELLTKRALAKAKK